MTAHMTAEQLQQFTAVVDAYLKNADLATVTARKVRNHLEESVGYDLAHLKAAVKELIQQRFDSILAQQASPTELDTENNGNSDPNESEFAAFHSDSAGAPNKRKHVELVYENDAKLAATLHQVLNSVRSSRLASNRRRSAPPKSRSTKKSKATVDSDGSGDDGEPEKKKRAINRNNPFNAPMQLSQALSNLIGRTECSRPECVKHIWAYVKQNGLQDPEDKRYIICDDSMKAVFNNAPRVHMFTMNKVLSNHLYPLPKDGA